jgi:hypothetical protein
VKRLALSFGLLVLAATAVSAQSTDGLDAAELLSRAHMFGNTEYAEVTAALAVRQESRRQSRTVDISYRKQDPGEQEVFAQVVEPPFLSNMRFLLHTTASGETNQWLATSRGVRQVRGAGSHESLFSSDFTVEELSGFPGSNYKAELLGREPVDGFQTVVIRGHVSAAEALYDTFVLRKDEASDLIVWIEFFRQNRLTKEYRLLKHATVDGVAYTERGRMETIVADSETELTVKRISFPESIPAQRFDPESLE